MAFNLDNLANVLRSRGLKVVETDGWKTRGYAQQDMAAARGVLWHHTATHRSRFNSENAPTLNMCTYGRSDLPGPLCNIVFGRDGTCYIVATGVANHAGTGIAPGVPRNMGNHYLIGIEMESSGIAPWDWTAEQIAEAPKLGAALELAYLQGLPADQRLQLAHFEYSDAGKIDPAGWPGGMNGLRNNINNQITAWATGGNVLKPSGGNVKPIPKKEWYDDMNKQELDDLKKAVYKINRYLDAPTGDIPRKVWATPVKRGGGKVAALQELADAKTAAQTAVAHNAALKSALDQIAKGQGVTIDYAKIEAAAAAGVASALVDSVELEATVNIKNGATK